MAIAPSSKRTDLPTGLLRLEESGYYEIRGDARGERIVASNVDLAESELASMDPQIVTAALEPGEGSGPAAAGSARIRPEDRERRQALWWYLLIAAFIILVAETALSNRLSRRRQAR
jgi:hypothetical protein